MGRKEDELTLYVVRAATGQFCLMTEEGTVILEAGNWRQLRGDLDLLLERDTDKPAKVIICVGRPRAVPVPYVMPPLRMVAGAGGHALALSDHPATLP
jgi:hypothetical protein